jgi:hypothetical protein
VSGLDLLQTVYAWLPALFAVDLLVFHLMGDHPLAAAWWWRRGGMRGALELA